MKRLLAVFAVLLSTSLNVNLVKSQENGCKVDLTQAIMLLEDAQAAFDGGDMGAAIELVSQADALLKLVIENCEMLAPAGVETAGQILSLRDNANSLTTGKASIEITQYIPDANAIVMDAARSNDEPAEDQRYILVELIYHCELGPAEILWSNGVTDLRVVGSRGIVYEDFPIGFPIEIEVFGGGQVTVQRAWLVGVEENEFQLFFDPLRGNRVFFSLE